MNVKNFDIFRCNFKIFDKSWNFWYNFAKFCTGKVRWIFGRFSTVKNFQLMTFDFCEIPKISAKRMMALIWIISYPQKIYWRRLRNRCLLVWSFLPLLLLLLLLLFMMLLLLLLLFYAKQKKIFSSLFSLSLQGYIICHGVN